MQNKIFVYHRAINSKENFNSFLKIDRLSKSTISAEGDICWSDLDGDMLIYIYHPKISGKAISKNDLIKLNNSKKLLSLETILKMNSSSNFILELKSGDGDIKRFFYKLKELLDTYEAKNILLDSFCVEYLKIAKKIIPHIKTSLHTKFVINRYLLETSYQKPYIKIHNMYDLKFIDYITISYSTTHVKLLNLDIDKSYKHIYKSNKQLNLGAIKRVKSFNKAIKSRAHYIYLRSKEVENKIF